VDECLKYTADCYKRPAVEFKSGQSALVRALKVMSESEANDSLPSYTDGMVMFSESYPEHTSIAFMKLTGAL
jgi:hypothetical protein